MEVLIRASKGPPNNANVPVEVSAPPLHGRMAPLPVALTAVAVVCSLEASWLLQGKCH